jgi:hypothetical protein
MANKIKLGVPPKTFKPVTLEVDMPDGSKGDIPLTFAYRTQDDYWAWRDEFIKILGASQPEDQTAAAARLPIIAKEARQYAAQHILGSIASWQLDVDLTAENLCQLFNEIPLAASAIGEAYQLACIQGRLGN